MVNLTPVGATAPGNGQLISSDVAPAPIASNVNFGPGTVDPNVAVAPIGADGSVCFVNSVHADVDIVIDQLLAIRADAYTATSSGAPERLIDTRLGLGGNAIRPDERRCMETGAATGSLALVNLLPLNATAPGSGVLVSPAPTGRPTASNVNFAPGSIDPNLAVSTVGPNGEMCFINSEHATVDLVADLLGIVDAGAYSTLPTNAPQRLVDTRIGLGGTRIRPSEIRCFASGAEPGDIAVVNLLALNATAAGNAALGGTPLGRARISNINFAPGSFDPNLAFAPVDGQGRLCLVNSDHATIDLVADLFTTIHAAAVAGDPTTIPARLTDSRPAQNQSMSCPTRLRCYRVDGTAMSVSNNGGRSWADVEVASSALTGVTCFHPDRCIAFGWTTILGATFVTLDAGRTWSPLGLGQIALDVDCPAVDVCITVGATNRIGWGFDRQAVITRDRGLSWQWLRLPALPPPPLAAGHGAQLTALSCGAERCLAQSARTDSTVMSNVEFATNDGWRTVIVAES